MSNPSGFRHLSVLLGALLGLGLLDGWTECAGAQEAGAGAPVVLRSAAERDYPPFCLETPEGGLDGFSIELLRAVLESMGREATFRTGHWHEVRTWLEGGEVDLLPLVGRTPEREGIYDFTFPYMTLHGAIVVRSETKGIGGLDDLRGRRVAVMAGDNAEEFLRRTDRGIDLRTTPSFVEALQELSEGHHDAVVIQRLVALRLIREMGLTNLRVLDRPVEGFRQDFCFAVREGDRDTLALLNEGLALAMADGTHRRLHAKWFASLELPTRRRIVVGGDRDFPPFEYLDENGRPAGYNVELMRAIAQEMGFDVEIRLGPWPEVLRGLETGEIDVIQGIFYSPDRDLRFDFTQAHLVNHCVAVVRTDAGSPPAATAGLQGLRLVVQDGDIMHDFALEHGLTARLTAVPSQELALREVVEGRQDCALVSQESALYWIEQHGWTDLTVGRHPLLSLEYCCAVAPGNSALLAQFGEGLRIVQSTGEYRRIREKWLGIQDLPPPSLVQVLRYVAMAALPLLAALVAFLAWSWSLRKQVALRTEELGRAEAYQRALLACSPVALYSTSPEGHVLMWNPAAERLLGWPAEEVMGTPLPTIPEEGTAEASMLRERVLCGESFADREVVRRKKDGTRFDAVLSSGPIRDPDGRIVGAISAIEDVTHRKQAERALRESEARFRSLVEGAPDAIFVQTDHCFAYVNAAALALYRAESKDRLVGRPVIERVHADYRDEALARIHRLSISREKAQAMEQVHLRCDGSEVPVEFSGVPITYEGKDGALIFVRDITDRKRDEERLRESEQHFRSLANSVTALIWSIDAGKRVDYTNRPLLAFTGRAPEDELGDGWLDSIHPDDRGPLVEGFVAAFDRREPFTTACRLRRHDGEYRWLLTNMAPRFDSLGRFVGYIGSGLDVTERKLDEDRIEHLNRVLRAIRDVNQLIVREQDREVLIREGCRLLVDNRGYASALLVLVDGEDRPTLWAVAGAPATFEGLMHELESGHLPPCCAVARDTDEVQPVRCGSPVCATCAVAGVRSGSDALCVRLASGGTTFGYLTVAVGHGLGIISEERELFAEMAGDLAYALGAMADREARLQAERHREDMERQLVQARKMEAVGQLAGGVAHDFNNILTVILGNAQLLLSGDAQQPEDRREDIEEIAQAAERAAALTRQLLAFSRRQVMRPKVLDLNEVVDNLLKMLRRVIGEDVRLDWMAASHLGAVRADAGMVEQILINLCVNARDAMPRGGVLTIETRNAFLGSQYAQTHPWAKPGHYVLLSVTDNGCGMDRQTLDHIFEPFFTTKEEGKGTGLGLATVYGIVKQHEGMVDVYSEPGQGTTFRIYLPRFDGEVQTAAAPVVTAGDHQGHETVLLAEDDPMVRALATTILQRAGYTVLGVRDGQEALDLYRDRGAEIAVLLLDVVMPRMGGHAAFERIRELRPDIPVLFCSGYSESAVHTNFVLNEGLRLLQKPYAPADLLKAVRDTLDEAAHRPG